ncbi:MAG: hypothetical protein AB1394_14425 [Bacteroidota bacterium]
MNSPSYNWITFFIHYQKQDALIRDVFTIGRGDEKRTTSSVELKNLFMPY